jgi:thiol:disulfide interchange protein
LPSELILEHIVAKNSKKPKVQKEVKPSNQPWISMRSGMITMGITSLALAVFIAWQVIPSRGWLEGILWGLLFGALFWGIFFGNILLNKFLRK